MNTQAQHAVILGGGFSGMLAALVCASRFEKVTLVERYPNSEAAGYAGTPQAHHVHIMSKKGQLIFDRLIPGALLELKDKGAVEVDWALNTAWQGVSSEAPRYASGLRSLLFSRKLLERFLYEKVIAKTNIVYCQAAVKDLNIKDYSVQSVVTTQGIIDNFDYCLDARGRQSTIHKTLEPYLGVIPQSLIPNRLRYVSAIFDHVLDPDAQAVLQYYKQANGQDTPLGYFASPIENNRYVFTTVDYHGDIQDPFARLQQHPMVQGHSLGPVKVFTKLHNLHFHFGRSKKWLTNFSVIGDAVCRLNPAYGHGLTLSLEQVELLAKALTSGRTDMQKLQKDIDRTIREPWSFVKMDELRSPYAKPNLLQKWTHKLIDFMGTATMLDPVLHQRSLEVLHRVKSPRSLLTPYMLGRFFKIHMTRYWAKLTTVSHKILALAILWLIAGNGFSQDLRNRILEANGQQFHTLQAGDERAPLLLFLHGFPEDASVWKEYVKRYSRDFHTVAVDLRGYGLSSKPQSDQDYKLPTLALDIKELIKALGHEQATTVSHDWGGLIAWYVAAKFSEVIERSVFINAPHPSVYSDLFAHDEDQKKKARYYHFLRMGGAPSILKLFDCALIRYSVENFGTCPESLRFPLAYYRTNQPSDSSFKNLPVVRSPTLVIWAEKDKWLSTNNLNPLAGFVSDLRIKKIPEGTHWVYRENSAAVYEAIDMFLTKR